MQATLFWKKKGDLHLKCWKSGICNPDDLERELLVLKNYLIDRMTWSSTTFKVFISLYDENKNEHVATDIKKPLAWKNREEWCESSEDMPEVVSNFII